MATRAVTIDTTRPRQIAGRLCVRIRPEDHALGDFGVVRMWRITHPDGRRRLAGTTNYASAARAAAVAADNGWTVVGMAVAHQASRS